MDWIESLQKAINFIEENILENIDSDIVSEQIYTSSHHFQKIFSIVSGVTVTEYVRNRRLSLAGEELFRGKIKVIDAALTYGYDSPESFTKAFTRFHGITPSMAKTNNANLKFFYPLSIQINVTGGFNMSKKLISQIPIRQLISMMQGQNYWFNGCMEFLMECLGESKEYNYWFFSGVTGDSFFQIFSKNPENVTLCYSHSMTDIAINKAFDACGYNYDYFKNLNSNIDKAKLDQRIREYIDKSIPVIARVDDKFHSFAIICGYDEDNIYYILGEDETPTSYHYDELIFIKDRKERPSLAEAYKNAVMEIPSTITMPETKKYSFGIKAFIDWSESFQNGIFDIIPVDDKIWYTHGDSTFSCWNMHGTYLCILGTNGCSLNFLHKALELNPDMTFIHKLIPFYEKLNMQGFGTLIDMEGGFGLKPEVIKNKEKMKPISEKITELANICDDILEVFKCVN